MDRSIIEVKFVEMRNANHISKNFIAWLVISIYLINCFKIALPFVQYELNKQYISVNLCVNKDKKEMNCNGKCYLAKELKKAANTESSTKAISLNDFQIEDLNSLSSFSFQSEFFNGNNYPLLKQRNPEKLFTGLDTPPPQA